MMSDYLRLTKLCEQRRLARYALTGRNGHSRTPTEEPLRKSLTDANAKGQAAGTRLLKSLDDLRTALG